jgi:hypothetical protein
MFTDRKLQTSLMAYIDQTDVLIATSVILKDTDTAEINN